MKPNWLISRIGIAFIIAVTGLSVSSVGQQNRHDQRALDADPRLAPGQIAPVLFGLGTHHFPITTDSPRAQLFFDQGLKLTYGFNHAEALRAFKEAARLDPDCAMAYWGWALVLGPNLNLPMQPEVVPQAYEAVQIALTKLDGETDKEAGLVRALALRYAPTATEDRSDLDAAYSEAMGELDKKYPDDNDIKTLYAASLMNLSPWDYWGKDGQPYPRTPMFLAALEAVMERDPYHEGALHYYIHAVEAGDAARAEQAADRLRGLAPGAGHLVHMPSHIYMHIGRYADAFEVNFMASTADEVYIAQCNAQGLYPLGYYPHNVHFLVWAGLMLGKSHESLAASRKVAGHVPHEGELDPWALYQTFLSQPYFTMTRFGMWDEILTEPLPPENLQLWRGVAHYAHGLAHLHRGDVDQARRQLSSLQAIREDPKTLDIPAGTTNAQSLLTIAQLTLSGEMAAQEQDWDTAINHLARAVRLQDGLNPTDPPNWYYPVRHSLGAVLIEAGRPAEAETVYWQDLRQFPENGYGLFGLWQVYKARDMEAEAAEMEKRFRRAWAYADHKLTSSRF